MHDHIIKSLSNLLYENPRATLDSLINLSKCSDFNELPVTSIMELFYINSSLVHRFPGEIVIYENLLYIASTLHMRASRSDRALTFIYLVQSLLIQSGLSREDEDAIALLIEAKSCISYIDSSQQQDVAKIILSYLFWDLDRLEDMDDLCQDILTNGNTADLFVQAFHLFYGARLDRYYKLPIDHQQFQSHLRSALSLAEDSKHRALVRATHAVYLSRAGDSELSLLELQNILSEAEKPDGLTFWAYLLGCIGFVEHGNFKAGLIAFEFLQRHKYLISRRVDRALYHRLHVRILFARLGYRRKYLVDTKDVWHTPLDVSADLQQYFKLSLKTWALRESLAHSENEGQKIQQMIMRVQSRMAEL